MVEKYIEKVMDRYFANKMAERIEEIMVMYTYETRITVKGKYLRFEIKKRKWKDEAYITVLCRNIDEISKMYFEITNKAEWIDGLIKGCMDRLRE